MTSSPKLTREIKSRINRAAWIISKNRNELMRKEITRRAFRMLAEFGSDELECFVQSVERGECNGF